MAKRGWSFSRQLLWICFSAVNCQSSNCRPTPSQWWQKCAQTKISLLVTKNLHNWWLNLYGNDCGKLYCLWLVMYTYLSQKHVIKFSQNWRVMIRIWSNWRRRKTCQSPNVSCLTNLHSSVNRFSALTVVLRMSISWIHPLKVSPRVQFIHERITLLSHVFKNVHSFLNRFSNSCLLA